MNKQSIEGVVLQIFADFYSKGISSFHNLIIIGNDRLLLSGKIHLKFRDGHCFAILNPDEELINTIIPGVFYSDNLLKNYRKQCDTFYLMDIDLCRRTVNYHKKRLLEN